MFEVYNPNIIVINVCFWTDDYERLDVDQKDLKFQKIKVDKKIQLSELKELLYTYLGLDTSKEIYTFRKNDYSHNNYVISEINFDNLENTNIEKDNGYANGANGHTNNTSPTKDMNNINNNINNKKTNDLLADKNGDNNTNTSIITNNNILIENAKIFIEYKPETSYKSNDNNNIKNNINNGHNPQIDTAYTSSKFIEFFDQRLAKIKISFNKPLKQDKKSRVTVGSYKFDQEIEIKPNNKLRDLKRAISDYLKLSMDQFIMKKNSHNGLELKNLNESLDKLSSGNLKIYIELGQPQKENELKLNIFSCELDMSFFLLFPYKITDLGLFCIDTDKIQTIEDLKIFLINELLFHKNINYKNSKLLVFRDYLSERPTTVI